MGPRNQEDRFKDARKCTQTNFSSLSHDSKYQICPLGLAAISDISLFGSYMNARCSVVKGVRVNIWKLRLKGQ